MNTVMGKIVYGLLFMAAIPGFLIWWTRSVPIPWPAWHAPVLGTGITLVGVFVMGLGMLTLIIRGQGLPMNAFPPARLVTQGIYRVMPHPIYSGAVMISLGVSLYSGSAAGLWLTTPVVLLGCVALVYGYESHYLLKHFHRLPKPWLHITNFLKPVQTIFRTGTAMRKILLLTEKVANSWRATRIGPLRIINHGVYAGLAGGLGAFLAVLLCGRTRLPEISLLFITGVAGAALWAQWLEGSSRLLRPFGYYGAVAGMALGGLLLYALGADVWLIMAAWAGIGPVVQAIGRVRCLIQGCCHGKEAPDQAGIRITNPHSRVCALAGLEGKSIYPTQLYSIIGNSLAGMVLLGLWLLPAPLSLIAGSYLILSGVVRFIEESYRGEPQTKIILGLPIYQWLSLLSAIGGMLVMLAPSPPAPAVYFDSAGAAVIAGSVCFVICWFAYGMDFPDSRARFSRLSG